MAVSLIIILLPGLGQDKISLKDFEVPEIQEVLKVNKTGVCQINTGAN